MLPGWATVVVAVCVALVVVPLPLGFVDAGFAVYAAIWGVYVVLPMFAMLGILAVAGRLRRPGMVRAAVGLVVAASVVYVVVLSVLGPYVAPLLLGPAAVVVVAAVRLFRSTSGSAASEPAGAWSGGSGGGGG